MSRTGRGLAVAALMLTWVGAAGAAVLTLQQVSPAPTYTLPGRAVDVAGISLGMAPATVGAVLSKRYDNVQTVRDNLGLEERGASVSTAPFVTKMTAGSPRDEMTVWFGTPTTGSGVVEVTRQLIYADPAQSPEMKQVQAELVAKYGPPADAPSAPTSEVVVLTWAFGGGKPAPCLRGSCRADMADGLEMRNVALYERAVRNGHPLMIVASLLSSTARPERLESVLLEISDAGTKAHSLNAAVDQMRAALGGGRPRAKPEEKRAGG